MGRRSWVTRLSVLGLFAFAQPVHPQVQTPLGGTGVLVQGDVTDQVTTLAIPAVRVVVVGFDGGEEFPVWEGLTDGTGTFVGPRVPPGRYELRADALSYRSVTHGLQFTEGGRVRVSIEMVPEAIPLEAVVASAFTQSRMEIGGFYERRAAGFGYTMDREEIEMRGPRVVSDLFAGIAGVQVLNRAPEPNLVLLRNGCQPRVVLDGTPFAFPIPLDTLLQPHELEAVELYHGASTPAQYMGDSCGTVMLWTRETAKLPGHPFSWLRVLVGAGIFAITVMLGGM